MDLPVEYLSTFAAIVDEGSFEGAARRLHVSPSAVSQRVRAMEQRVGLVLLTRKKPIAVTPAGATVLRVARQLGRLANDAGRELGIDGGARTVVPLAVNADALATWLMPPLARAAEELGISLDLRRADEAETTSLLRDGSVMAALTSVAEAVPGCTVSRLGAERYRALASPAFVARWFPTGLDARALGAAPLLDYDRADTYQSRFLRAATRVPVSPPRHTVPSSTGFVRAAELGLGWGMVPEAQATAALAAGTLVPLPGGRPIELPVYWQRWDLDSPILGRLSEIIAAAARDQLPAPA
ncbi:LysR family transcriptional regulator ArgP [Leucobacter sp. M11]|uniref:LysR family transcriptional regulator ArgP n=1 Tax=Leucobacter sp. M11 TaxID=2993565 RepID=UPI002D7EC869|nr:LysR family transcriptional regulator ArgP [Leucobacter sp. M11]MEB4614790.1 LysR family transcriptional regulator ArgP [Leucobacter sp. M11]